MTNGPGSLWSRRSTVLAGAAIGLGFVLVALAFAGARDRRSLAAQIGSLNLAVVGITLSGAAELLWLLAGRQRIARVREQVVDGAGRAGSADRRGLVAISTPTLVVVDGSTWLHLSTCRLATGKQVQAPDSAGGLSVCPVCEARP